MVTINTYKWGVVTRLYNPSGRKLIITIGRIRNSNPTGLLQGVEIHFESYYVLIWIRFSSLWPKVRIL